MNTKPKKLEPTKLFIFTNQFPYLGGEPFLEMEMKFLTKKFESIILFPGSRNNEGHFELDSGVQISEFEMNEPVSTGRLLMRHWNLIARWWISEFIRSPHRIKYIKQFTWNFNRFLGLVDAAQRLRVAVPSNGDQIFYSYWFNEWATILAIAKDMGLKGRFITRAHGYDYDEQQQSRGYHPFRYSEWKRFDRIIQVSEYGFKYMRSKLGLNGRLSLLKLGTGDYGLAPIPGAEKFQIVSCSSFVDLKRIPLIARVLSKLNMDFHWTHFGDGNNRPSIEVEVNKVLRTDQYTFAGFIQNQELMKFYEKTPVDLFVNLSNREGVPVSLMEAISFGIPVVGCRIGGVPEIVNNVTGLLLEEEINVLDAARRIEVIIKTKSRSISHRNDIRSFWRNNYQGEVNYNFLVEELAHS